MIQSISDTHYVNDFLLTFRSFATPKELLQLLIKRFKIPEIQDDPQHEKKRNIVHIRYFKATILLSYFQVFIMSLNYGLKNSKILKKMLN